MGASRGRGGTWNRISICEAHNSRPHPASSTTADALPGVIKCVALKLLSNVPLLLLCQHEVKHFPSYLDDHTWNIMFRLLFIDNIKHIRNLRFTCAWEWWSAVVPSTSASALSVVRYVHCIHCVSLIVLTTFQPFYCVSPLTHYRNVTRKVFV